MEQSTSKDTIIVNLAGTPAGADATFNYQCAIQGNSTIMFTLTGIGIGDNGVQGFEFEYDDSKDDAIFYPASFTGNVINTLPVSAICHLYYHTDSSSDVISANISVLYQPIGTAKPLSANHIVEIFSSATNTLDKEFSLLNSNLFTNDGVAVPSFNFESNQNIIYPVTFFELLSSAQSASGIYLTTNPETDTQATNLSALSASGIVNTDPDGDRITAI